MHAAADLTYIAITALIALVFGMGMDRLKQPAVVGYILAGIVLGPTGLELVSEQKNIALLAELGVLMLLFIVGMQLSLRGFREVWKLSLGVAAGQTAAGVGLMLLIGWGFGWSPALSVVLGFVVALSSTAVVVKLLEQLNILRQPVGQITIGILIAQDLAVVPMLLSIDAIGSDAVNPLDIAKIIAAVALLVTFILFLSRRRRVMLPFSHWIRDHPDLVPLAGLAYCFGAAMLTGLAGLSPVLGAFLAGLLIGASTSRPLMIRETRPVQALLMMVFFLSVGLLIDLNYIWANVWTVLLLLFLVSVVKTAFNIGIIKLLGEPWPHAFIAGVLLAQIGEFSLVISQSAAAAGIMKADETQLIIAVTALSLLVTPLWLSMGRRVMRVIVLRVTSYGGTLDAIRATPAVAMTIRAGRRTADAARWTAGHLPRRAKQLEHKAAEGAAQGGPSGAAGAYASAKPAARPGWWKRTRAKLATVPAAFGRLLPFRRKAANPDDGGPKLLPPPKSPKPAQSGKPVVTKTEKPGDAPADA